MDLIRFDPLTRSLGVPGARRSVLTALLGIPFGLVRLAETAARKGKKTRRKKNGKKGSRPSPPRCTDGVRNGSESDVDCGGSCPRCANGKNCATRSDCAGGLCSGGRCQACAVDLDCGDDADGQCYCADPASGGPNVCTKGTQTGGGVASCASCPSETICFKNLSSGMFLCFKPCGAPS
jgi:hypothetical protein